MKLRLFASQRQCMYIISSSREWENYGCVLLTKWNWENMLLWGSLRKWRKWNKNIAVLAANVCYNSEWLVYAKHWYSVSNCLIICREILERAKLKSKICWRIVYCVPSCVAVSYISNERVSALALPAAEKAGKAQWCCEREKLMSCWKFSL